MVENACDERSFTLPRDRKPFDNEANFFQRGSKELCRSIKQEANVNLEQKSSFIRADVVAEGGPPPSGVESSLSPEGSGSEESSEYKLSKMFTELSSGERRGTQPPGFAQCPAPISEATRLEQKKILNIAFSGKTLLQKEAPLFLPPQEPGRPSVLRVVAEYTAEGGTDDRPHKCRQCSRAFKKASNLKSHVETHRGLKPHVCELCGKAYSHQGTLQQHKRLHTGERPYCCPFCIRTYIWSSDFRKHIRTHTGEKPYTCGACGKAFVRSSDLRKHERNIHTNNKPLPCQECGKTFNKPLSLLRHQRTHLGERPFLCPDCGKAFAVASRMVEHQRTHSGARPYICPVCLKAFTKSSNLAEHQTLHSGLRPFKCSDCNAAFAQPSRLVRHRHVHVRQGPHLLPQPCPP